MDAHNSILLAHGSGGKLTHELIKNLFLHNFSNPMLASLTDAALLEANGVKLAFTTDSYVVKPLFFAGGDIGELAVFGTVNDLSVMGAKPLFISCGLIIEQGLDYATLEKIVRSIQGAAKVAKVSVVTGDTKVVERGSADKLFINTSGVGLVEDGVSLSAERIEVGDRIVLSGTIGDHGIAVLSEREGFDFQSKIVSDCAPLNGLISKMLKASDRIKFMRDSTRGGLATTLNEIAAETGLGILIEEDNIPVREGVGSVCELLGLDPLYIANEGKVVAVVHPEDAELICRVMRGHELGCRAEIIGEVVAGSKGRVFMRTAIGGTRIVDMMVGDQLPRIC